MDVERELQAIVEKKVKNHLEPDTKLVDAGLDSLDVMELAFDIEDRFKVQLPQIGTELISLSKSSWQPRRTTPSLCRPQASPNETAAAFHPP